MTSTTYGKFTIRSTNDNLVTREWEPSSELCIELQAVYSHAPDKYNEVTRLIESGLCGSVAIAASVINQLYIAIKNGNFADVLERLTKAKESAEGVQSGIDPLVISYYRVQEAVVISNDGTSPFDSRIFN